MMEGGWMSYMKLLFFLFSVYQIHSLKTIELDENTPSVIEVASGSIVKLGWVYRENEETFGEFFCGYRNKDGRIVPLAIDINGVSFPVAYIRGQVNSEKPIDDRDLLRRTTNTFAENVKANRYRRLELTSLTSNDAGSYFCGLHTTYPRASIQYGGEVTLKLKKKSENQNTIIVAVTVPLLFGLIGMIIMFVWWKKFKGVTKYSLADDDSADEENIEYERK